MYFHRYGGFFGHVYYLDMKKCWKEIEEHLISLPNISEMIPARILAEN